MAGRQREIALAVLGLTAYGAAVVAFGALKDEPGPAPAVVEPRAVPGATSPMAELNAGRAPAVPSVAAVPVPAPAPEAAPAALRPSFDIVRVEPTGESVIAGRAAPNAAVELLRDGAVHDRTVADAAGGFAFVAPPLPPGTSQVSLRMTGEGAPVLSEQSVTVVVAPRRDERPVVALASPGQPTAVLSAPEPAAAPGARPALRVEAVEAEESGQLYVSGRAAPGATVRLSLNETPVASGTAAGDGRVAFAIRRGVSPGDYRVRLDEVGGTGALRERAEVAFAMPAAAAPRTVTASADPAAALEAGLVVVPAVDTAIVARGDSLWRISRRVYGSGVRYTVIYGANQERIRNPGRIYPGQVFVLPGEGGR